MSDIAHELKVRQVSAAHNNRLTVLGDTYVILSPQERDEAVAEIERLRAGYRDIMAATVAGRVCDDVAWFDGITTLYDFCDLMLAGTIAPASGESTTAPAEGTDNA
jgi:hypothetical protein